jgi:undecaprenyl-diphosphatase
MDYRAFKLVNGLAGHSLDGLFALLAKDLAVVMMVLVALVFLARWRERRAGALLATVSAALALLVNQPISHAVARMRPYAAHPDHAHLLIARSQDFSFPSDHATGAFALAFGIWLYDRRLGRGLLVLAAILAFSRVVARTHYPGVLAGAAIGVAVPAALFALPASRRLLERAAAWAGSLWDRVAPRVPARAGSSGASRP